MENSFGKLLFGVGLDTSSLGRDANTVKGEINKMSSGISSSFTEIDGKIQKVATALGGFYAINQAKAFASKVYEVRSAFQDTEAAMKVFLGSGDKAKKFMKELQDYAWYNMFEFSDLTQASSQLLAYGNDVEGVIPILDKLSNIATATKQPLIDLVDMYNRAKNVGQIDSVGFDQWAKRGLIISDTLKSVGIEVERGSVSFEHLSKAIDVATSKGGKFHNIMGEQMNNLSASYGQLQDDITNALNEIGESSEGVMKKGIEAASFVVGNYKEIASLIMDGVVAYGAYRTAIIAINAVMRTNTALFALNRQAALLSAVAHREVSVAQMLVARGANAIKTAFLSNPITVIAVALSAVAYGFYKVATAENAAEVAARSHTDWLKKQNEHIASTVDRVKSHIAVIKDETKSIYDRIEAYRASKKEMPEEYSNKSFSDVVKMTEEEHSSLQRKYSDDLKFKEEEERLVKINSLLNEYNRIMDIRSGKVKGVLHGHELPALEREVQDFIGANFWEKMKFGINDIVPTLEEMRGKIISIRNENYQIIKQEEYEALSVDEKISRKQQELNALELQKKLLEDALAFTGKTADQIEQATQNWSAFDIQSLANLKRLQIINTEIGGIKTTIVQLKENGAGSITYREAREKARLEWVSAKKRLSEYERIANFEVSKYNELKESVEKAKKDYENLGGVTTATKNIETKNDVVQKLKAIEQQKNAIKDSIVRAEIEIEQARINAIKDSEEKRTAQITLDKRRMNVAYKEMLQSFIDNENELAKMIWERKNPKWREKNQVFVEPVTLNNYRSKLEGSVLDVLDKKQSEIDNYETAKERERLNQLLEDYADYLAKRKKIAEKYDGDIKELEKKIVDGTDNTVINRAIDTAISYKQKEIDEIDLSFLASNKNLEFLLKGVGEKNTKVLKATIADIEKLIRIIKGIDKDNDGLFASLGIGEREFSELQNNVVVIDWFEDRLDGLRSELKSREADGKNIFNVISESIKAIQSGDINNGLDGLHGALGTIIQITDLTSELMFSIAEATGGSDRVAQSIKDVGDTISSAVSGGAATGGSVGGWIGTIVGAVVGAATSLFDILGRESSEKERREIEKHKYELQKLQREYDTLGRSIKNAYSYNKSRDIIYQIANLQQQAKYLEEQAKRASEKRKDGSMYDADAYNQYKDSLNDIYSQIDDLKAHAVDAIFGDSIQSSIDKFANAYVDAWQSGNDVAGNVKEVVNGMIRGVILEMLRNDLTPMVEKIRDMIYNKVRYGGVPKSALDGIDEYIDNYLNGKYQLNMDGTFAQGINEKYKDIMDKFFSGERTASAKGFASMSQDSADELNGRFTAIQGMIFEINNNVKQQAVSNATILLRLSGIEENTSFCRRLDGIDQDVYYMRNALETIRDRGVIVYGR